MAIYGRFRDKVTILRRAELSDIKKFEGRKPDKKDRDAFENCSLVIVKQDDGKERLYHLAYMRADDGFKEIAAELARIDAQA